jgi:hypothetical protein
MQEALPSRIAGLGVDFNLYLTLGVVESVI